MATAAVRGTKRLGTGAALAAAALVAVASTGDGTPGSHALAGPPTTAPNIVVVMTDDQDARSLSVMDAVQRRLVTRGTTFENFFATYPRCCPSRATFLTGQYSHNHGVLSNTLPSGGWPAFEEPETALPVALDDAGYRTELIGKYLNGYRIDAPTPPGWDVWRAAVGSAQASYRYALRRGDEVVRYGATPADYRTNVYSDLAISSIERAHELGEPLFLTVAPGVPHGEMPGPPAPGPAYGGRFDDEPLPKPPSFDEADVSDKPAFVRDRAPLTEGQITRFETLHRARLASLLPVDALVRRVMDTLRKTGELENTYVLFTSDNGFMLGQHRLGGKVRLYEESARVPMVLRGPGIPAGAARRHPTGNIDLTPTILDAADATALREPDGRSLLPLAADPTTAWRREILLENVGSAALRSRRYMYAEHPDGERELYDLGSDPFQLESLHLDPAHQAAVQAFSERLATVRDCDGTECP